MSVPIMRDILRDSVPLERHRQRISGCRFRLAAPT